MYKTPTSLSLSSADRETERREEEIPSSVMGEEKNQEEKKPKKVDEAPVVVVVAAPPPRPPEGVEMRMFLHCEGCARKVRKSLKGFNGVEEVKTDCRTHMVLVKGKGAAEDPMKVVERVQAKTGKKVELVSLLPPPEAQKKIEEKKEELVEIVVVMKVHMHCEACAQEIKKRILKIKGVELVETDLNASRAMVKGVFDPPKLVDYVYKRTGKRAVIINVEPVEKKCKDNKLEEEENEKNEEKKDSEKVNEEDSVNKEEKKKDETKDDDREKKDDNIKDEDQKKDDNTKDEEQKKDEKKGSDEVQEDNNTNEEEKEKDDKKEDDEAEEEKADKEDFDSENEDKEKKELSSEEMAVIAAKIEQKRNEFFYYCPVAYHAYFQHNQHLVYAPEPQVVYPPQIFSDENPNACSIT